MKIEKLAIDGGTMVRSRPLPPESPGIHWIDNQKIELVREALKED